MKRKRNEEDVVKSKREKLSNLTVEDVRSWEIGQKCDLRDTCGRFCPAELLEKKSQNIFRFHFTNWSSKYDIDKNICESINDFAALASISNRKTKDFVLLLTGQKIAVGMAVDICYYSLWKQGTIMKLDCDKITNKRKSDQIQVKFVTRPSVLGLHWFDSQNPAFVLPKGFSKKQLSKEFFGPSDKCSKRQKTTSSEAANEADSSDGDGYNYKVGTIVTYNGFTYTGEPGKQTSPFGAVVGAEGGIYSVAFENSIESYTGEMLDLTPESVCYPPARWAKVFEKLGWEIGPSTLKYLTDPWKNALWESLKRVFDENLIGEVYEFCEEKFAAFKMTRNVQCIPDRMPSRKYTREVTIQVVDPKKIKLRMIHTPEEGNWFLLHITHEIPMLRHDHLVNSSAEHKVSGIKVGSIYSNVSVYDPDYYKYDNFDCNYFDDYDRSFEVDPFEPDDPSLMYRKKLERSTCFLTAPDLLSWENEGVLGIDTNGEYENRPRSYQLYNQNTSELAKRCQNYFMLR